MFYALDSILFTLLTVEFICYSLHVGNVAALQAKLNEEKSARQKSDLQSQEKERQMSMLSVDYRQIQQRLQKLEGEHRQEMEKVGNDITGFKVGGGIIV